MWSRGAVWVFGLEVWPEGSGVKHMVRGNIISLGDTLSYMMKFINSC